ncbi:hypothetical protein NEOLEDRAFT_557223 [Neolentinus lepideus HHB14362 ss-1]|uniref:Uncharacterized protein n=1 Tax=Neolentinus lepideus HHB14362 ss-1 TaxID=1314782 RepID=A0A165R5C7_9AGAM|nr:hypothetical protein NEOLEDRAFT_557223 [Neolentinus lepideus HHB14362 ss-1]
MGLETTLIDVSVGARKTSLLMIAFSEFPRSSWRVEERGLARTYSPFECLRRSSRRSQTRITRMYLLSRTSFTGPTMSGDTSWRTSRPNYNQHQQLCLIQQYFSSPPPSPVFLLCSSDNLADSDSTSTATTTLISSSLDYFRSVIVCIDDAHWITFDTSSFPVAPLVLKCKQVVHS